MRDHPAAFERRVNALQWDAPKESARNDILQAMFLESSDDMPSSDDHLEAVPWLDTRDAEEEEEYVDDDDDEGECSLTTRPEPNSPTSRGRIVSDEKLTPGRHVLAGKKRSAFSRSSSVNDPFGAFGSAATNGSSPSGTTPMRDCRPKHYQNTTPTARAAQRRRIGSANGIKLQSSDVDTDGGDLADDDRSRQPSPSRAPPVPARIWYKQVEKVWDKGETTIDLSNHGLSVVHPVVADLAKYVSIGCSAAQKSKNDKHKLHMYLQNNALTRLPSAFFELSNLRVLSLRSNKLKSLPAAVGSLRGLEELNIANNELRFLPAEIQMLTLEQFRYFPNPFVQPAQDVKLRLRKAHGSGSAEEQDDTCGIASCLNSLQTRDTTTPSLRELCIRRLLSPLEDANVGTPMTDKSLLLQSYENGALRQLDSDAQMESSTISLLESARRSVEGRWGSGAGSSLTTTSTKGDSWCRGVQGRHEEDDCPHPRREVSSVLDNEGDDVECNPHFNVCPGCESGSPQANGQRSDWPTSQHRSVYSTPMETRLEWVSHIAGVCVTSVADTRSLLGKEARGTGVLPLLWRGCQKGCLDFLLPPVEQLEAQ